jgi:signal transduction histidine kinase
LQGVELQFDAPRELPTLEADPGQLQQVLYNLIFNALDVLAEGGTINVTVDLEPRLRDTLMVIRVADDGPGLPPGIEDRLFEPFVSTKDSGLGLGLSICRRIVESHSGSIRARNGATGGAVFEVRLPCLQAATVKDAASISPGAESCLKS